MQLVQDAEAIGPWRHSNGILLFKEKIYLTEDLPLVNDITKQVHKS